MTQPNILLLWTDEQRDDTISCYGNDFVKAPNLNRLAGESFVFENAYCTVPVCTPSRGCIMTGTWPHTHGAIHNNVPLKPDALTIAELLPDPYHCAYYGKWHLGDEIIRQHGFDEWCAIEDFYHRHYSRDEYREQRSAYHDYLVENGFTPDQDKGDGHGRVFARGTAAVMPERFTKAGFLGHRASEFVRRQRPDRPWFLSVNFLEPHMPFYGPLNDLYDPADVPTGPQFGAGVPEDHSDRHRARQVRCRAHGYEGKDLATDAGRRRLRANYYGLVTLVDNAVGRILSALEESGQAENTIVIYTSDHGEMAGDYCMFGKGVLYEPSVRIPWFVRVPSLGREQVRVSGRVSQIDLAPTVLDLIGHAPATRLHGKSRAPVLRGEQSLDNNDVFVQWNSDDKRVKSSPLPGISEERMRHIYTQNYRTMITHDGWKLNLCTGDRCELFDLDADPQEFNNRYNDVGQRGRIKDMVDRMREWQSSIDDPVELPIID